jgi:dephospho-CoA kinase
LVITGGIGSGKTVVAGYLSSKGIPVYDCDSRTKALYYENPLLVMDIEESLGECVTDQDGTLDRKKLGSLIFSDKSKLAKVEEIVHPMVYEDFVRWREDRAKEAPFVVMESAIFLEKPLFHDLADAVLLLEAPGHVRLRRVSNRDKSTQKSVRQRMKAQRYDRKRVDAVIVNNSDIPTLYKRVDRVMEELKEKLTDKDEN